MKITHIINSLEIGGAEMMLLKLIANSSNEHQVITLKGKSRRFFPLKDSDVIVSWMYHSNLIAFFVAKILHKRLIWTIHSEKLEYPTAKITTILINKICAKLSRFVDVIIAPSDVAIKNHIKYGYDPKQFKEIPIGFDSEKFKFDPLAKSKICSELSIDPNSKILITIGRLSKEKNYALLLEAFSKLENVVLLMCGKNLDKLPQQKNVLPLGIRQDIPTLMSAADLYVSSSRTESFPNVLGEAMLCETPCLATDVGSCREIIGDTGFVVPLDADLMAEKIRQMLEKPLDGKKARERIIGLFDIKKIVKLYEEEF